MAENNESNTFAQVEQEKANNAAPVAENKVAEAAPVSSELSLDDMSTTAVGEQTKYNRPNLNGTEDVIEKFQIFMPNIAEDKPQTSQNGSTDYWKASMVITYASKNEDGMNNREYISGAKVFKQKDGQASAPSIYYAESGTQGAALWVKVAEAKGIEANELSPREFMAFLNNKPKVLIESVEFDNFVDGRKQGKMSKNMPSKFL